MKVWSGECVLSCVCTCLTKIVVQYNCYELLLIVAKRTMTHIYVIYMYTTYTHTWTRSCSMVADARISHAPDGI